ncbi:unnamed protein product [Vitrella brassicaformis CCMP3155]|uniref:Uncharacterized protein n=1 Tax=Vitrella brassicaformis (strain CCMP3155) TaxID=1169540 RepID=A0A0G4H7N5_VITBC|nr:unnamed protein product [Vitrella brassicaformis CCMP3155]|eukprot:CEM39917.1 unnamed protein product [Vitrella brassicaformis CCMP3155]
MNLSVLVQRSLDPPLFFLDDLKLVFASKEPRLLPDCCPDHHVVSEMQGQWRKNAQGKGNDDSAGATGATSRRCIDTTAQVKKAKELKTAKKKISQARSDGLLE